MLATALVTALVTRPRALIVPAAALDALRAALLAAPDGEQRLRDAGYVAGLTLYDDFAADVREREGTAPDALPLARFGAALSAYLDASGWGLARVHAHTGSDVVRLASADWVEGEADAGAAHPACHFSTGVLAGVFGRTAGRSLAALEVACRSCGDARCEFVIGSRDVLERMWQELRTSTSIEPSPSSSRTE